ncbi:MAG: site-specific recombinase [Bacteroidia bacterium]
MAPKEILERIEKDGATTDPAYLIALIDESGILSNKKNALLRIIAITDLLNQEQHLASALRNYLVNLYNAYDPLILYTDAGILPGHGFFTEAFKLIRYKILPPLENKSGAQYLVRKVFHNKKDYRNFSNIDPDLWQRLFEAIGIDGDVLKWQHQSLNYLLNALMILSQRITAIGLEPEVISKLPEIEDLHSPFFGLYREVQQYVDRFKNDNSYISNNEEDYRQILVMCSQCEASIDELHKHKDKYGISINLAYYMVRLEQHVRRLKTILQLIQLNDTTEFNKTLFGFTGEVIHSENKKYSLKKHLNDNLSLLAYKITEHTSLKGEHYRTVDRREYYSMFKSAMGGGLIVAFLVILKVFAHHLNLPPFGEAFTYSMIYASGFIVIHLLHYTLATKQPAMTANTIAASLDGTDKKDNVMLKTAKVIAEISSAQFISLIGNIVIVLPAAYFLGWIYFYATGSNVITGEEANHMIASLHPFKTGALFYAAIAGVFLMSSGMIAGYYDNKVVYSRIPERLKQHPFLKRIFSERLLEKLTGYLKNNLGIILGNFFLGIFLGSAPLLGKFFGLPIDVRHVTLSTGNFGLALQSSISHLPTGLLLEITIGIIAMGIINLFVSFGLAIYVAVRSRSLNASLMRNLLHSINIYFRARTADFFIPPKKKVDAETAT